MKGGSRAVDIHERGEQGCRGEQRAVDKKKWGCYFLDDRMAARGRVREARKLNVLLWQSL